jgi:hypothetical protein
MDIGSRGAPLARLKRRLLAERPSPMPLPTASRQIFVLFELLGEPKSTLKMQTLAFHVVNIFDERMQRGQNEFGCAALASHASVPPLPC